MSKCQNEQFKHRFCPQTHGDQTDIPFHPPELPVPIQGTAGTGKGGSETQVNPRQLPGRFLCPTGCFSTQVIGYSSLNLMSHTQGAQRQEQGRVIEHKTVGFEELFKKKKGIQKYSEYHLQILPAIHWFLNTMCMKAPPEPPLIPYNNIHQGILLMWGLNPLLLNTPDSSAHRVFR